MMIQPNEKAKMVLESIAYVTIATVDEHGQPWNTPVAAYHFPNYPTLYWASWQENQHSKNIRANGKAFIVAYDSTPVDNKPSAGVYIQAEARELSEETEVMQAALVFGDDPYNPSDGSQYLGTKPRRIYKAVPLQIWMNGDSDIDGNFIDIREPATV